MKDSSISWSLPYLAGVRGFSRFGSKVLKAGLGFSLVGGEEGTGAVAVATVAWVLKVDGPFCTIPTAAAAGVVEKRWMLHLGDWRRARTAVLAGSVRSILAAFKGGGGGTKTKKKKVVKGGAFLAQQWI
jgi:hypothetical protein